MRLRTVIALGVSALPLAACGLVFGSSFEAGVVIPESDYRIEDLTCSWQTGESVVDGETISDVHWVFDGILVNNLDSGSRNYDLRVNIVFSDGSTKVANDLVFPLAAGDSTEIGGFITAAIQLDDPEATISECTDVTVYDSVLNH